MRIDTHQIHAFLAVADALQFRVAAERLHVTQPALTRTIQALEELVGTPLFVRTTRQVQLTTAGEAFAEHCRASLAHLDLAFTSARRAGAGEIGHLRVAYMDFAINGAVPELITNFHKAFPGLLIDLVHMPTDVQKAGLLNSTIDAGFMIGPRFLAPNVESIVFERENMVALLPPAHRLCDLDAVSLQDLVGEPFVLGSKELWEASRGHIVAMCHRAGFSPAVAQEASTSDGIFGLVAAGMGVSLYPLCARNIHRDGVVVRPVKESDAVMETVFCWRGETSNPASKAFVDTVREWVVGRQGKAPVS